MNKSKYGIKESTSGSKRHVKRLVRRTWRAFAGVRIPNKNSLTVVAYCVLPILELKMVGDHVHLTLVMLCPLCSETAPADGAPHLNGPRASEST